MAEETTAGTAAPEPGDAAVVETPTTESPSDAGRDAAQEPDYKQMYLDAKSKVEEANRLRDQVERLQSERAQPQPAAASATEVPDEIEELEREAAEFANPTDGRKRDPVAALVLRERAERLEHQRNEAWARQLLAIADVDQRRAVYSEFMQGGYADPNQARVKIERDQYEKKVGELTEQLANKDKKPEVNNVPGARAREAPAGRPKEVKVMTRAEWQRDQDTLDDDERREQQLRRREGRIRVE